MSRRNDTEEYRQRNREYQRKWYLANKETQAARIKANRKRAIEEAREYIAELKRAGCSRCPEDHPATLDFHHRDQGEKVGNIAVLIRRANSLEWLKREIEKCELVCSNCHRKHHHDERQTTTGRLV